MLKKIFDLSKRGVTVTSLTIYVIVATIVVGILVFLNANFFSNINDLTDKANIVSECLNFKSAFIRDIKSENDIAVTDYNDNLIRLSNNVKYEIRILDKNATDKKYAIYRNDVQIAKSIVSHTEIEGLKTKEGPYFVYDTDSNTIKVGIKFSDGKNTYVENGAYIVGKSVIDSWDNSSDRPIIIPVIPEVPSGDEIESGDQEESGDDEIEVPEDPGPKPESELFYAILYSDGLVISKSPLTVDTSKTLLKDYGQITLADLNSDATWISYKESKENIKIDSADSEKVKVTSIANLFAGSTNANVIEGLENFDLSEVTNAENLFKDCVNVESVDLRSIDTSSFENVSGIFDGCTSLKEVKFNNVNLSKVEDMSEMFRGCTSLEAVDMNTINGRTENLTDMSNMFANCTSLKTVNIGNLASTNLTSISKMFYNCQNLQHVSIGFITSTQITDLSYLFYNCGNLNSVDFGQFNTSNVTDMSYMFANCTNMNNATLPNSDTSKVENMEGMYLNCSNIGQINFYGLETDSVTNMSRMFEGCTKLNSFNQMDALKTKNVTNMSAMFKNCTSLNGTFNLAQYSSTFDTSSVVDFSSMFEGCTGITTLNISNFNTQSARYLNRMFMNDSKLDPILVGSNWKSDYSGIDTTDMFEGCKTSVVTMQ